MTVGLLEDGKKKASANTAVQRNMKGTKMNDNTCTDEQRQKWTLALQQEMGLPESGSVADAVRWFATGVPDEPMGVQLSTLAMENRIDVVSAIFQSEHDPEPTAFAVAYRTMIGADFGGCLPVALGKDQPLALYAPQAQYLYQLDERGTLTRRTGQTVKGLQLAHRRAMKRLRRAAAAIDLSTSNVTWETLRPGDREVLKASIGHIVVNAA